MNYKTPDYVYGLCVKKCNIRKIHGNIEELNSDGFDLNQEGVLLPFSSVIIRNKWENYYYINSSVASGWVTADAIAVINSSEAKRLFYPDKFAVVTEPEITICGLDFYMSCKIPIFGEMLQIPFLKNGNLFFKESMFKEGLHMGYLPFSRNTVLSQAVKFLGTPYDWGEKNGGLDCSSLIMYSFGCCGIVLPRQSVQQSKITFPVSAIPLEEIHSSKPADIIFMPGHVMLSLGNGCVIHSSFKNKKVCVEKL